MNPFRLVLFLLLTLLALPLAAQPLQWEERAPMMTPRFGLTAAVLDGQIYVLGGQDALGNILDTATRYNPRTNQWSTLPPMSKPRVNAAAVARNGKVYVIGGRSSTNTVLNDVEFFDPATNAWQPFQPIAIERQGLAAVLRDTSLFVAGGSNAADEILDSIEIYDESSASWVAFDDEVRITGVIEAIGSNAITVAGTTFAVTSATEIEDDDGNDITIDDLAIGMTVEIRGENDASGTLTATRIEVEDDGSETVEVTDVIEALGSSSLTVAGLVFEVNSATQIEDADGNDIPFSSLEVGMTVEVRGEQALDGTITATRIRVDDEGDDGGDEAVLEFCTSNIDLNTGDTFNIRDYVQVQDNPSQPIDWQQVFFTYTEAGANNPTTPPDWNLAAFNAGQNVTITEADGAPGTGNEGQGRYEIYIVRAGLSQFDDALTFRVDDERDSEVEEAKCSNSTSAAKQSTSSELLGTARAAFAAVTVDADVIFLGGFNRGPLDLAQRLDSAGVVTSLAPLPSARGSLSAAAISDTIYAIGGRDGSDRVLADVQRLVLSVGTWEPMPRLITAREGSAASAFEGALFVFGGRDPNGRVLGSVETFGDLNTSLEQPDAPSDFVLAPNYPNPFSNTTTISFSISTEAAGRSVRLTVFDVRGRHVATLVDGVLAPGAHQVSWNGLGSDGMRVGSGVYVYRLQQGDFMARQMMAIIR